MKRSTKSRSLRRTAQMANAPAKPRFNGDESPLAWLASRKDKEGQPLLSRAQYEAGERLRRDFTFALLSPRVTASYSAIPCGRAARRVGGYDAYDMADGVVAARERFNRAVAAVGPDLSGILLDVCCYLRGLETIEKSSGWPQRSAKIVLAIALQHLARHYGMLREEGREAPARVLHWGAQDYRPAAGGFGEDLNGER